MFDEEPEDVGQEIEAYCARCKIDTAHTVVSRYDDEIRRVRCNTCEDVHAFRKPRGEESGEEAAEAPVKKKATKAKPTWEQVMARRKKEPRAYNMNEIFGDLDLIEHPKFGVGFVSELIGIDKIEVTFQQDKRILAHNRQKLPLHTVLQQRHEADAKAKADGRNKARELKEAREAARLAREASRDLDDLDLPDDLPEPELGEGEMPDGITGAPPKSKAGRPSKISAKALAELDDEDEAADPEAAGDDEAGESSRRPRGRGRPAKAAGPAKAAAAGDGDEPAAKASRAPRSRAPQKEKEADKPEKAEKADKPEKAAKAAEADKPARARKPSEAPKEKEPVKEAAAKEPAKEAEKEPAARRSRPSAAAKTKAAEPQEASEPEPVAPKPAVKATKPEKTEAARSSSRAPRK